MARWHPMASIVTVIHDIGWLHDRHKWPGLSSVVIINSTRELHDKTERETRFYITSLALSASQIGPAIRHHWPVENSFHWIMDMVFRAMFDLLEPYHATPTLLRGESTGIMADVADSFERFQPGATNGTAAAKAIAADADLTKYLVSCVSIYPHNWCTTPDSQANTAEIEKTLQQMGGCSHPST